MATIAKLPTEVYETHRSLIWALCYRMTGNSADADDLVQETFIRALENPPARLDEPLRPWLVRVAINLSRDHLRRRRRHHYTGPWLPSPISTEDLESPASYEPITSPEESPMARYDMLESISFAFLVALEALTPLQRAVLLLRDVFDYSTSETAAALGVSETNVKVTLLRARRTMYDYDKSRVPLKVTRQELTQRALEQFLYCINSHDVEGLKRLLAEDVINMSDGGGKVAAALLPIYGRDRVVRLIMGLSAKYEDDLQIRLCSLNGLPAIIGEHERVWKKRAPRWTLQLEVDQHGRIYRIYSVLAPEKLSALP
ncbi:MAG: sigma-70 family RNA polymerase sigma factor [Acidobacteriota bacterium]